MALLIKVPDRNNHNAQPVPIWLPDHYAYERHLRNVDARVKADMERQTVAYSEEKDRALKDTKPDFIVDKSIPGRTIITVGMGELFREDLKDMALRTLEKPDPRNNPDLSNRGRILNDLDTHDWAVKRARKGIYKSFAVNKTKEIG